MRIILALVAVAACGPGIEGEPMTGTVAIQFGDESPALVVGGAVLDQEIPDLMRVQLGSNNLDCDTYLDTFAPGGAPEGVFIYFSVAQAPGVYSDGLLIDAMHTDDFSSATYGGGGEVTIETVGDRVTGSVSFVMEGTDFGVISADGTFDVKRCF